MFAGIIQVEVHLSRICVAEFPYIEIHDHDAA
jgi:hypothetical protein